MSLTPVTKTGSIREIGLKSRGKTQPIPPLAVIDRNRQCQEQLSPEMWASKIKDITSRLSRPTISSSLKTIHGRPELKTERDVQFWNTVSSHSRYELHSSSSVSFTLRPSRLKMAYCSSQYQKKFNGQTARPDPAVALKSRKSREPMKRCQPVLCSTNHKNTSGNSLPMLSNQRGPGCRN